MEKRIRRVNKKKKLTHKIDKVSLCYFSLDSRMKTAPTTTTMGTTMYTCLPHNNEWDFRIWCSVWWNEKRATNKQQKKTKRKFIREIHGGNGASRINGEKSSF